MAKKREVVSSDMISCNGPVLPNNKTALRRSVNAQVVVYRDGAREVFCVHTDNPGSRSDTFGMCNAVEGERWCIFHRIANIDLPSSDESEVLPEREGLKGQIKNATKDLERQLIVKALQQTGRNITQAAQLLKISRKSLQIKMKEFGLRE